MQASGSERGYLLEHFRLFHTIDQQEVRVDWHFHTFDKVVFFLSGHAEYTVESETFPLQPGDLILVSRGQLHRMRAYADAPYDRFILYLDSNYLTSLAPEEGGLNACFSRARKNGQNLLRVGESEQETLRRLFSRMHQELSGALAYARPFAQALLVELMVLLCRAEPRQENAEPKPNDEKIAQAIDYIQTHLGENLSCDTLAARLYMSRSSFQHRFREATGCPPHAYIRLKRLLRAGELLSGGTPAVQAGRQCGYTDHSAFCHAFTAQYGMPPSAFRPRDIPASAENE